MTVCYFGMYKPKYTRNRVLINGLRAHDVDVIECQSRESGVKKYLRLFLLYLKNHKSFDIVVVGFPGHTVVPLAWLLTRLSRKKLIFDAFVSMYDSVVYDREECSPYSFTAVKYWLVDWLAGRLADLSLIHI